MELVESGRIIPAIDGDAVPKKLGDTKPYVGPKCELSEHLKFACLSCAVMLANGYNVVEHCSDGRHMIAAWCSGHGAEAFMAPATVPAPVVLSDEERARGTFPFGANACGGPARGDVGAASDAVSTTASGVLPVA